MCIVLASIQRFFVLCVSDCHFISLPCVHSRNSFVSNKLKCSLQSSSTLLSLRQEYCYLLLLFFTEVHKAKTIKKIQKSTISDWGLFYHCPNEDRKKNSVVTMNGIWIDFCCNRYWLITLLYILSCFSLMLIHT